ncbi:YbaB/EbfC family nucleoid-associated protein [Rubellicoccus peritrichatus]|uniref:Nucleoid-associated protein RZN69_06490 n=1 Tax=Rubellicoccus peritrichatus TaxID=3080537 RepID=A0AAQ3LFE1_9BACT|nr:YbaB/EbfC family nucleoid-associated protein [Puniceicoccus sp. CR14]WOO42733.1 YbaB/EbfC family nucleoid-associated protein [Puniceicoccus sp. CR14]
MAGVGKLMKQMKKMQQQMDSLQEDLSARELEISSGGGAITLKINGQGDFLGIKLDPEFLKEDASFIEETLLEAIKEAAGKAKELNETEMGKITQGMGIPGLG